METWPTTSGWAYTWSSTGSVNTSPNCWTLTLAVVNAVSLSFQPDRLLSLCCVSTDTGCGVGGGFVTPAGAELSLHVPSNRNTSDRGSLRFAMGVPRREGFFILAAQRNAKGGTRTPTD